MALFVRRDLADLPHNGGHTDYSIYHAVSIDYFRIAELLNEAFPDQAVSADLVYRNIVAPNYAYGCLVLHHRAAGIIGTATARRRFGMGEIAWLVIGRDHRRRGLGSHLVWHLCRILVARRHDAVCMYLPSPTIAATSFAYHLKFYEETEPA